MRNHGNSDLEGVEAEPVTPARLIGRDLLAATLLTLAAAVFIGVAWKSTTHVEPPALPATEVSQRPG